MGKNILLVGVGGQGTILVSKILSQGLMEHGFDVKMSEIHGMSQRGGSVSTHIKYGERVYSPVISEGEADIMIAFEQVEALRWISHLKPGGTVVVNEQKIRSMPVLTGAAAYPEGIVEELKCKTGRVIPLDAGVVAEALGNSKVQNVVLLGLLTRILNLPEIDWQALVRSMAPPKFAALNVQALLAGQDIANIS